LNLVFFSNTQNHQFFDFGFSPNTQNHQFFEFGFSPNTQNHQFFDSGFFFQIPRTAGSLKNFKPPITGYNFLTSDGWVSTFKDTSWYWMFVSKIHTSPALVWDLFQKFHTSLLLVLDF
jgi:hypothetical protein